MKGALSFYLLLHIAKVIEDPPLLMRACLTHCSESLSFS